MPRNTVSTNDSATPLVVAWLVLSLLTALSFGARYLPLGVFASPVALAIACAKAYVVLTWFMQLRREATSIRLLVWVVFGTVVLGCAGVAGDAGFREVGPGSHLAATNADSAQQEEHPR